VCVTYVNLEASNIAQIENIHVGLATDRVFGIVIPVASKHFSKIIKEFFNLPGSQK